jgi:hypothetical protein
MNEQIHLFLTLQINQINHRILLEPSSDAKFRMVFYQPINQAHIFISDTGFDIPLDYLSHLKKGFDYELKNKESKKKFFYLLFENFD